MRIIFRRRENGEHISLSFPVVVAGILLLLAVLGGVTAVIANKPKSPMAVTGTSRNYARLPEMSFAMGNDRQVMDVRALIELDPGVEPTVAAPYLDRISDRLSDRIRQLEPSQLAGADGAKLVKSAIAQVLDREMKGVKVRDVLLDRFVIR